MFQPLNIPTSALKYILYQRTKYQTYNRNRIVRSIHRKFSAPSERFLLTWEARLRKKAIKKLYFEDMQREYELIRDALPNKPSNVLDIGCGIAGIDIFIYRHYNESPALKFYLFDKSQLEKSVHYGFNARGAFYNSLEIAKYFLQINGIALNQIVCLEVKEGSQIPIEEKIDLVISLISWGYHYPVGTYIETVLNLMNKGARLIIDIRPGTNGYLELTRGFESVIKINSPDWAVRYLCIK